LVIPPEPSEVPPIGTRWIAAKSFGEPLRRTRARYHVERLAMIQPRLEVIGRGFDHHRRLEAVRLHPFDRFGAEVINETQRVKACGPDVNVGALGVLVPELIRDN